MIRAKKFRVLVYILSFLSFFLISCNDNSIDNTSTSNSTNTTQFVSTPDDSKKISYEFNKLFNFNIFSGTPQDIEIYGDYVFVASSDPDALHIYSKATKRLLFQKTLWLGHGSSMQFSNERYDSKDKFPLLYVGGLKDYSIQVLRITIEKDEWHIQRIKRIKIPSEYGTFYSPSIDTINHVMYAYGTYKNPITGQKLGRIIHFDLNDMNQIEENAYSPNNPKVENCEFEDGVYQGHKFVDGSLFILFTRKKPNGNYKTFFCKVNLQTYEIVEVYEFTDISMYEGEGIAYQNIGKKTIWYYSDTSSLYRVVFR